MGVAVMSKSILRLMEEANKYVGVKQYSAIHQYLVAKYNEIKPYPVGYKMTCDDDWCDMFVTVMADMTNLSHLIGRECGVQRHVDIFQHKGIWLGRQYPKVGDIIVFDWEASGWADHIGFVYEVDGFRITTIEGNSNGQVAKNKFAWNDWRIMGYARPKYNQDDVVERQGQLEEVFLEYQGAKLTVPVLLKLKELASKYRINVEFLIVMLHFESMWGTSQVAKLNNNWAGLTYNVPNRLNPKIPKLKGSKRLIREGGYYFKYDCVEDFLEDWLYLLDNLYQVKGPKSFEESVKGLFCEGGAPYDYAAIGYHQYLIRMLARRQAIADANPDKINTVEVLKSTKKSIQTIAKEVIRGLWSVGEERFRKLKQAGYNAQEVQRRVNELLS